MKKNDSQAGFSLIEILITISISAIGGYLFISLQKDMLGTNKFALSRHDISTIINEIEHILSSTRNCKKTFENITVSSNNLIGSIQKIQILKNDSITVKDKFQVSMSGNIGASKISIKSYEIRDVEFDNQFFSLAIIFKVGKKEITRTLGIKYALNENVDQIGQCYAISSGRSSAWDRSDNINDIYFLGGNIGVLKENYENKIDSILHLEGTMRIKQGPCNTSLEGSITYDSANDFIEVCQSGIKKPLKFKVSSFTELEIPDNNPLLITVPYSFCGISNFSGSGFCKVWQQEETHKWNAQKSDSNCTIICFSME